MRCYSATRARTTITARRDEKQKRLTLYPSRASGLLAGAEIAVRRRMRNDASKNPHARLSSSMMMSSSSMALLVLLVLTTLATTRTASAAFHHHPTTCAPPPTRPFFVNKNALPPRSTFRCAPSYPRDAAAATFLRSSSGANDDASSASSSSAVDTNDEQPSPPPVEEEDPELTALKKEIADLESALKSQKRVLMNTKDSIDEYSKQGYARKVAEMENMRRTRSNLNKNSRSSATAAVVSEFIPSYDQLVELKDRYADVAFAKQYEALAGTMRSALGELGVQDFSVQVGDRVDVDRMNVVERSNSDDVSAGSVLEVVNNYGLELQGNVVRQADVVASSGPAEVPAVDEADEGQAAEASAEEDGSES